MFCVFQEVNLLIYGSNFLYVKFFRVRKIFRAQVFAAFIKLIIPKMRNVCARLLFH